MTVVNNDRNSTRGLCTRLHTSPALFPKERLLHISGFRIQRFHVFVLVSPVFTPDHGVTTPVALVSTQSRRGACVGRLPPIKTVVALSTSIARWFHIVVLCCERQQRTNFISPFCRRQPRDCSHVLPLFGLLRCFVAHSAGFSRSP